MALQYSGSKKLRTIKPECHIRYKQVHPSSRVIVTAMDAGDPVLEVRLGLSYCTVAFNGLDSSGCIDLLPSLKFHSL